jgi:hypothetical protein
MHCSASPYDDTRGRTGTALTLATESACYWCGTLDFCALTAHDLQDSRLIDGRPRDSTRFDGD